MAESSKLRKIREAKKLADAARWQLLDVVIWLNEIEEDELAEGHQNAYSAGDDLLGVADHYADYEDYAPRDADEFGGDCS